MSYLLLNAGTHIMGYEILEAKVYVIEADKYKTDLAHLAVETQFRTGMIEVPWYFVDEIRELVYKGGVLHETVGVLCQEVVPKPIDLFERQLLLNGSNMNATSFNDTGLTIYSEVGEIVLDNGVVEHLRKVLLPTVSFDGKFRIALDKITKVHYCKGTDSIVLDVENALPIIVLPTNVADAVQDVCAKVHLGKDYGTLGDITVKVVSTPSDPTT